MHRRGTAVTLPTLVRLFCLAAAIVFAIALVPASLFGQSQQDSTVSSAPGGVPVPAVPAPRPSSASPADLSPASNVFRVRVVDGRNGAPMDRTHLQLWYDDTGAGSIALTTNAQGIALMPAPVGMPVRVLVSPQDAADCTRTQKDQSAPLAGYNLATVASTGAASANHCGHIGVKPKPGELVLFARPLRWYEGLNR